MSIPADVSRHNEYTLVTLHGELGYDTVGQVRDFLLALDLPTPPALLLVDLSKLTHLDSSGLGLLVGAHKRSAVRGEDLVLVCPQRLRRLFRITGLEQVLTMHDSLPDALAQSHAASLEHQPSFDEIPLTSV